MSTTETTLLEGGGTQLADRINAVSSNILAAKESLRQAILAKESTCTENPTFAELKSGIENIQSGAIRTYNKENLEDYSQGFSAITNPQGVFDYCSYELGFIWDISNTIYFFYKYRQFYKYTLDSSTLTNLGLTASSIFGIDPSRLYHFNYPGSKDKILSCAYYDDTTSTTPNIFIFDLALCTFSTFAQLPYKSSALFVRQSYPDYIYGYCCSTGKLFRTNIISKVSTDLLTIDISGNLVSYYMCELIPNNNENLSYLIVAKSDSVRLIDLNNNTYTAIDDSKNNYWIRRTIKGYTFIGGAISYEVYSNYKVSDFTSNLDCVGIEGPLSQNYTYIQYWFIHNSPFCITRGSYKSWNTTLLARLPRYMLPVYPGCIFSFDKIVFKEYLYFNKRSNVGTYFSNIEIIDPNTETIAEEGYYYYIIDPKPTGYIKYI